MCAFRSRTRRNAADVISSSGVVKTKAAKCGPNVRDNTVNPLSLIPAVQDGRLRKLLQVIESRPSSIHDWATEFNLSHSHLQHLFKRATGFRLGRMLNEQRLQRAAKLLANSNMSIKEIASAVGYEHTSSFTRAFERRFAQGPRCYRQEKGAHEMLTNSRFG